MNEGYSSNPLIKKLGIKEGYKCLVIGEPEHYVDLLGEIPADTEFTDSVQPDSFDFAHVFTTREKDLSQQWDYWKSAIKKTGMLWISWPKQSSKIPTDLNGNIVREVGLKGGLVDVKVCAVDKDWSGLKFVWRKADR